MTTVILVLAVAVVTFVVTIFAITWKKMWYGR